MKASTSAKLPAIPAFIVNAPSDQGNDNNSANEWHWIVQHEIDLYEEEETSDITNRRQYNAAKKCLAKLALLKQSELMPA